MPVQVHKKSSEDFPEVESESGKNRVAADDRGIFDPLGALSGPVDRRAIVYGIEKPGETRAVFDVFLHLGLKRAKLIRTRA